MAPARGPFEPGSVARWAGFVGSALLIAARAPRLVLEPRLWAEEANVHLAHSLSHGILSSLLLVPTSSGPAGYLNLPANLAATLSAHFATLESAAAIATAVAFLLQLLPFALVLWGRSRFWSTPARRFAVCAVFLFAPAVRPDVWLSTINSQVFCGLAAFVILTEDLRFASRRRIWIYRAILVFCGLSGAYAGLLFLPFLMRAYLARSAESRVQATLVGLCAAIQFVFYLTTLYVVPHAGFRFDELRLAAIPTIVLLEHIVEPIIGAPVTERALPRGPLADNLYQALPAEAWESVFVGLLSMAVSIAFWWWLSRWRTDPFYRLFPLSFVVLAGGTSLLAAGLPRRRYAVLSSLVLLAGLLVASWSETPSSRRRQICRLLVGVSLLAGVATFWLEVPWYRRGQPVSNFGSYPGRPDWRTEISLWRENPRHRIRTWPYTSGLSWSTALTTPAELRDLQAAFDRWLPIQVRSGIEHRTHIGRLPAEFRLRLHGHIEDSGKTSSLSIAVDDSHSRTLRRVLLTDLGSDTSFIEEVTSSQFDLSSEGEEDAFVWLSPGPERPAGLSIDRIDVLPLRDGLLDVLAPRLLGAR